MSDRPRPRPAPVLSADLFGGFTVRGDGVVLGPRDMGGAKPRQLLGMLLVAAGTTLTKDHLVEALWPRSAPTRAVAALESYVSVLRARLRPVVGAHELVRTGVRGYRVEREDVDVDLHRFDALVERSRGEEPVVAAELLERAVALADRPLLVEEPDAAWADDVRRAHAPRMSGALLAAAVLARDRDDVPTAVRLADRVLAREPLNEAGWGVKIEALGRAGRAAEALAEYGLCRRLLADELGCAPGPALQAAFRALLRAASEDEAAERVLGALPADHDGALPVADVPGPVHGAVVGVVHHGPGRVKTGPGRRTVLTSAERRRHS